MPKVDPADQVQGQMQIYDNCDTIPGVDNNMRMVRKTMKRVVESGKYPELPAKYGADIDLLLDRRRWLEIMLEDAPC